MSKIEGKITVEEAISELLYRNDNVIVPKFGGFVKEYRASTFDYVQGKISPPSSSVTFNENLKIDDGLLIDFYKTENQLNLKEAQEEIEQFSRKAKLTLANKEVVSFPKIGRLLKDYENQTKFISHNHNFNTETFGLSEVSYYPILREIPKNEEVANIPKLASEAAVPSVAKKQRKRRSQKIAKMAIPFAIILMLVSAFFYIRNNFVNSEPVASNETETVVEDGSKMPVNIKPQKEDEIIAEPPVEENTTDNIDYANDSNIENGNNGTTEAENDDFLTEDEIESEEAIVKSYGDKVIAPESPKNTTSGFSNDIIFVGLFSKQTGVANYTNLIVANEWRPYTEKLKNGMTRVGLVVPTGGDSEKMLLQVKKKIDKGAYIAK